MTPTNTEGLPDLPKLPDVSDLLVWAVEDDLIRMSKIMDADLQDALVAYSKRILALACYEAGRASHAAPTPAVDAVVGEPVAQGRCETCGGRDVPWGHGKCHCFKNTKDNDEREHHGADAQGAAQVGGPDASGDCEGARPGENVCDEHRGSTAAPFRHADYSLGDSVRIPDKDALREGIDLTPEPEDLRALAASVASRAQTEPDALREDAERYRWLRDKPTLEANVFISVVTPLHTIGSEIPAAEVDAAIDAARAALAQHQAPQQGEQA